jgi:hypothetical protein
VIDEPPLDEEALQLARIDPFPGTAPRRVGDVGAEAGAASTHVSFRPVPPPASVPPNITTREIAGS